MKNNMGKIGAIMAITGIFLMFASATYMLIQLNWVLGATLIGGVMTCVGFGIINISKDNEDEEEETK
jgi:hypothetical protein